MQEKKELKELKEEDIEKVSGGRIVAPTYCNNCKKNVDTYYKNFHYHCSICHSTDVE